jgi:tRNA(Ile)-lysidine synthetase-like protein
MSKYSELIVFWFINNKDNWFGCTKEHDTLITHKYKDLLANELNNTINKVVSKADLKIILAKILLCDQISRHVFRDHKEEIKKYDAYALRLIQESNILDHIDKFIPEAQCFLLMPYRHTFNSDYLKLCLNYVIQWRKTNDHPMYRRFYGATLKAISKINNEKDLLYINSNLYSDLQIRSIIDNISVYDLSLIKEISDSNTLYNTFISNIPPDYSGNLTISVSGGVDSMICLFLLKKLSLLKTDIKPHAISINYKNRSEQDIEIYMVHKCCHLLEIPHYVRIIDEINRTRDSDRELYETLTRDIRFDCYKKISGPIILGHNQDDTIENIFSNIKKKKNYDNLFGMSIYSSERGVSIWRPLLKVSKKDIVKFALEHNIPFTYDSTPSWCERGKLRDIFIPFIDNFDESILHGLLNLSENFHEIYKIYEKSLPSIVYYDNYCIVDNKGNILFFDYWKKILNVLAQKYRFSYIKNKSINHMICQIKNKCTQRITLSKNVCIKLSMNHLEVYVYIN